MSQTVSFNNTNHSIPNVGDRLWGQNVTNFLISVAQNALSKAGGSFTLTADANFGTNFGLVAKYIKSTSSNIATTGVIRFANNEGLAWRNAANSADKTLKLDSNDKLAFGSAAVSETEFGYLSGVTSSIQTQLDAAATDTDLTTHEADTSTHGVGTVAGLTETQVFTNKDYDGGTAANSRRITLPKDTYANLLLLTRKEGTIWYATDLDTVFYDDGSSLLPVGSASGSGELNAVSNPSMATATTGWTGATRDTTNSPLNPVVPTCIAIANTATTETSTSGGYFPISSLATGLRSRRLKVEFYYSTPATDNYAVSVWKGSTRIPLTTDTSGATNLPKNTIGKFYAEFDADSSASSYTPTVTRTSGSTGTCYVTNVILGPGLQVQGPMVGKWVDVTPSVSHFDNATGLSINVAASFLRYKQETDSVRIQARYVFTGTGSSGSTLQWKLSSLGISPLTTAKQTFYSATAYSSGGTGGARPCMFYNPAGNAYGFFILNGDDSPITGNIVIEGNSSYVDSLQWDVLVPITELSNAANVNLLNQQTQSPIKAGTIMPFAGATVPTGWLECDGSSYSQTLYPDLYATLGSTWATCTNPLTGSAYSAPTAGNFRVPDLRGTFLRGVGTFSDGIGTDTTLAGYQADQMQGHYHAGGAASTTSNQVGSSVGYIQRDNSGVGNPSSLVAA
ncbi:MAG TPA: phage tail protein, partial [Allocoleopsis sp.]